MELNIQTFFNPFFQEKPVGFSVLLHELYSWEIHHPSCSMRYSWQGIPWTFHMIPATSPVFHQPVQSSTVLPIDFANLFQYFIGNNYVITSVITYHFAPSIMSKFPYMRGINIQETILKKKSFLCLNSFWIYWLSTFCYDFIFIECFFACYGKKYFVIFCIAIFFIQKVCILIAKNKNFIAFFTIFKIIFLQFCNFHCLDLFSQTFLYFMRHE